jgi:hypothetical protein
MANSISEKAMNGEVSNEKVIVEDKTSSLDGSHDSPDHLASIIPDDPKAERALTNKLDWRLTPILGILYMICFLDRTNIANARLAGLEAELNMPSTGFNTCLWIFYIPFVLFEIPSNMIMALPWVQPNIFLGLQCFILGQ